MTSREGSWIAVFSSLVCGTFRYERTCLDHRPVEILSQVRDNALRTEIKQTRIFHKPIFEVDKSLFEGVRIPRAVLTARNVTADIGGFDADDVGCI